MGIFASFPTLKSYVPIKADKDAANPLTLLSLQKGSTAPFLNVVRISDQRMWAEATLCQPPSAPVWAMERSLSEPRAHGGCPTTLLDSSEAPKRMCSAQPPARYNGVTPVRAAGAEWPSQSPDLPNRGIL